ncbi:MAG: GAF domain-containing protein, partial [Anaerolineales bacterium]
EIVHPDYQELIRTRGFARQKGEVVPSRYEFKILTKDGQERWVDFTAKGIEYNGKPAAIGTAFDITDRVQAQERLRQRAEALATLHDVSLDISAPHDLLTLLQTIVEKAAGLLDVPGGSLYLCEVDRDEVYLRVEHYDNPRDYTGIVLKFGEGAAGLVAQTRQPLIVDDYRVWAGRATVYERDQPYRSVLSVPMIWQDRVLGVLQVMADSKGRFGKADQELLELFASQAAAAVQNARLFERAKTEHRRLAVLYEVGQALATTLDADEILEQAIALTCQGLGGLVGEACLYLPEERRLSLRALYGREIDSLAELDKQLNLIMGTGLVGWVAQNREPANVSDVSQDERWQQVPGLDDDVISALSAPIISGDQLQGTLSVLHREPAAFSDAHLDWLLAICQQVSLALSNARRYQDVNRLVDLLASEQRRLEALVEELPVGLLLLDEECKLLIANPKGREILSALSSNGIKSGETLTHLGDYPLSELFNHRSDSLPVEIPLQNPTPTLIEAQASLIEGEKSQQLVMLRDVTREREVLDYLQAQDRLATVGQLAAGIAHDFNNIMASIVVYSDLLMMEPNLSDEGHERLKTIHWQVERAASLIRQILDFSRRSVMEQIILDLLPFLKEMKKLLRRTFPETIDIKLIHQANECTVKADPTQIQQVFMNLAVNARDAMPEGGTLRFGIDRFHLEEDEIPPSPDIPAGEWVQISVADTGTGIPLEDQAHIFEPFYTTKPVDKGTGLGLAQVYGIVKQHGGYIDVHSQIGEGTTFQIYLPFHEPSKGITDSQDAPVIKLEGRGENILLVEDDLATRSALRTLLEVHDYRVLIAANGTEALEILGDLDETVRLAVSDVVMPEMGGVDLYRALQERWPDMKMLLITGHPVDVESQIMLESGRIRWLQKPFSVREFSQVVQELLVGSS